MPLKAIVTEGTATDCHQASRLIEGLSTQYLLADRAYDNNAVLAQASALRMNPVIPPQKSRKVQREIGQGALQVQTSHRKCFFIGCGGRI